MKRSIIALTGGIGSGKSTVAKYLREKGYVTVDCDQLSKQVAQLPFLVENVKNLLGEDVVVNGALDRVKIRAIVFADENLHKQYSRLFYGEIKLLLDKFVAQTNDVIFVEIPVFDAFAYPWTEVWFVERNIQSRVESVVLRDNVVEQNVLDIISRQNLCDSYTVKINNDGTLQQLYLQIDENIKRLTVC